MRRQYIINGYWLIQCGARMVIKEFPYYNEIYMKIFEDISDLGSIDDKFFKDEVGNVDYGYRGDLSPVYLLNDLER